MPGKKRKAAYTSTAGKIEKAARPVLEIPWPDEGEAVFNSVRHRRYYCQLCQMRRLDRWLPAELEMLVDIAALMCKSRDLERDPDLVIEGDTMNLLSQMNALILSRAKPLGLLVKPKESWSDHLKLIDCEDDEASDHHPLIKRTL